MGLKRQSKDFYKYFRFIVMPVVFIAFYVLGFMINPYRPWQDFFERSTEEIVKEWMFV